MSVITLIDLGANPNDGQGDPLRTGGQEINTNFTNLNVDKLERGGYAGTAQQLKDEIDAIDANGASLTANNTFVGFNNFNEFVNLSGGINVIGASEFDDLTEFKDGIRMSGGTFNISGATVVQTNLGKIGRTFTVTIDGNIYNFEKGILVN